ncbi:MAG: hypothetical protein GEU87_09455 [Alphaproteobacteria bacterium]|nr:hypothetical protein [Alphaproteobacteria bacterium]
MVDIGTIAAAVSGLNTAREMTQALIGVRDAAVLNDKVIELQSVILAAQGNALTAQSEQFALLQQVRELEEQMARMETWDAEKEKYELKDVRSGVFAYARKEGMEPAEPPHHICADCYQNRQKSVLQKVTRMPGRAHVLVCQQCGSEIYTSGHWQPEHGGGRRRR